MAETETTPVRLKALELQMGRLESDQDSEKDTRARSNERIFAAIAENNAHLRKMERVVWMGLGALTLLQFVIPLLVAWLLRN